MKKFEDLEFKPHKILSGSHAVMDFPNGYGVSVLFGDSFYSNGIDTYELGVLKDGHLDYSTSITNDVLYNITKDEVTEVMIKVQNFE